MAALLGSFINESNACHHVAVSPIIDSEGDSKWLAVLISEAFGTFIFVFLFMLCTDTKTQFSKDKVINCFIISSAYVGARLMCGGTLVTGLNVSQYAMMKDEDGDMIPVSCESKSILDYKYRLTGPLLNPALALGQMLISMQFTHILQYLLAPFIGSAIALVFYEFVFVKSQEYLADGDEDDSDQANDELNEGLVDPPIKGNRTVDDEDDQLDE